MAVVFTAEWGSGVNPRDWGMLHAFLKATPRCVQHFVEEIHESGVIDVHSDSGFAVDLMVGNWAPEGTCVKH